MKIGIISDIHSNIIALKACILYMQSVPCDEYLFLRGNREDYMLEQRRIIDQGDENGKWRWNSATGNLLFTYRQLNEKDFSFFDSLPITFQYQKTGFPSVTICHGSPVSSRERLLIEGKNTQKWLKDINTDYLICAHTHLPGELECKGKHYYNCGSVGIAIGTCGYAQCMIIEDACIKW